MARRFREIHEMREIEEGFDNFVNETRYFKVSQATYSWLAEHGCLAAISLEEPYIVSVSAELDSDTGWNGWHWIHDEMISCGMNPEEFGL